MSNSASATGGPGGFLSLLAVLFIGLKLTGHIDWSWWWVLAPIWIPLAIAVVAVILWLCGTALINARNWRR